MDLCTFRLLRCSQTHSLPTADILLSSNPWFHLLQFWQYGWSTCWWRKAKKSLNTSIFSIARVTGSPVFLTGPTLFPSFYFIADVPEGAFLINHYALGQIYFCWCFCFPKQILGFWDNFSAFIPGYFFLFPPSVSYLFKFVQELLVDLCRSPGILPWFHLCRNTLLLTLKKQPLDITQLFLDPSILQGSIPQHSIKEILEETKVFPEAE